LSGNLTDLMLGVFRIHKLALQAFVSVILVAFYDIFPHKEALIISVDIVSKKTNNGIYLFIDIGVTM